MPFSHPVGSMNITQGFLGAHPYEPKGWTKLVNGIQRGWRHWVKGSTVRKHAHLALDFSAADGTPLHAVHAGTIVSQFVDSDGARVIYQRVRRTKLWDYYAVYWHLHPNSFFFKNGTFVKDQTIIARTGATGKVTGAHLHFEYWRAPRYTPKALLYRISQRIDPRPFFHGRSLL